MRGSVEIVNKAVLLNLAEERNGVRVIFGGNDGILVTIDGQGHIVVRGPEGPGDPEVRKAVNAIVQGVELLTRVAGGGVKG